jgi:Glycosyltransferase family 87
MAAFATIGTPAALMNVLLGQTGCYTAALLGSGMMFVERRPLFAGVLLGLISCKPQLGILVIVALAAGRHGRVLIVAAATAFVLALASTFLFGPHIWIDFLRRVVLQQHFIELHIAAWFWMPTVFAMVRLMTASSSAAYAFQGLSTVSAVIAVAALWRR